MNPLKFFRTLFALLVAMAGTEMKAENSTNIAILYTGDIHGHLDAWKGWPGTFDGKTIGGMDHLATAVAQARREFGTNNTLLLDAGDAIADTLIARKTKGIAIIDAMNAIGYDAMTLGNHEFDYGVDGLKSIFERAQFPLVAANVKNRSDGSLLARPFLIQQVGSLKVGIIGIGYPNTPLTTAKKNVAEVKFDDPPEVLQRIIPQVRREGAKIVVVLSHYGLGADMKLAKQVSDIDVIVGGHSHNRTEKPQMVGRTIIVHAGAHASDLGVLKLTMQDGKIISHENRLVLLDNSRIASDPKVRELILASERPFETNLHEQIARNEKPLPRAQTIAGGSPRKRNEPSPADSLFADIAREQAGADVAILPGVGYGVALPEGNFSASDLRNLLPHDSKLIVVTLTGAQIRELVEQSVENSFTEDPKKKVGGLFQVSGMTFRYDSGAAFGQRVTHLEVEGTPVRAEAEYKIATNSMLADGGHNYITFHSAKNRTELGDFYEMIARALKEKGLVVWKEEARFKEQRHPSPGTPEE